MTRHILTLAVVLFAVSAAISRAEANAELVANPNCLEQSKVDSVIGDFEFINKDPSVKLDLCNTDDTYRAVLRALIFLKDLPELDQTLDQFNFGSLVGHPYAFFKERIKTIVIEPGVNGAYQCVPGTGAVAFVKITDKTEKLTAHICPVAARESNFLLSYILVHEARHAETGGYPHSYCTRGSTLTGRAGCDFSVDQHGSYAVGMEYMVRIARTSQLNAPLRQHARSQALVDITTRFIVLPLGMKERALMQTEAGSLEFYDGDAFTTLIAADKAQNHLLVTRDARPLLFNKLDGSVKEFYTPTYLPDTYDILVGKFRDGLSATERADVVDVLYGPAYGCLLFRDRMLCGDPSGIEIEKKFTGFKARKFIMTESSLLIAKDTPFITSEDGSLLQLPSSLQELKDLDTSTLVPDDQFADLLSVSKWTPYREFVIAADGSAQFYSPREQNVWVQAKGTGGMKFTKVISPWVWSAKLDQL